MSSTGYPDSPETAENVCPRCGQKGKPVQGQTIKALLGVSLRLLQDTEYYFCRTQSCQVVYYAAGGQSAFTTDELKERVYQKEPEAADVLVCYCFGHTVGDIKESTPDAFEAIIADINQGIQADQCACDLRNPQGSCCIGNVRKLGKLVDLSSLD